MDGAADQSSFSFCSSSLRSLILGFLFLNILFQAFHLRLKTKNKFGQTFIRTTGKFSDQTFQDFLDPAHVSARTVHGKGQAEAEEHPIAVCRLGMCSEIVVVVSGGFDIISGLKTSISQVKAVGRRPPLLVQ